MATGTGTVLGSVPELWDELFRRVALWQRDRGEAAAAEAALTRALALDPDSEPLLEALAEVQRRAPSRALVGTLLRLGPGARIGITFLRGRDPRAPPKSDVELPFTD